MKVVDIEQYFSNSNFAESLVLEYVYDGLEQTVTLVCDYAEDKVQALLQGQQLPLNLTSGGKLYHRDLRRLVFAGVNSYERDIGTSKALTEHRDHYSLKWHKRSVTIQDLRVTALHGDKNTASIDFGDFGRSTFLFTELQAFQRLIRATGEQINSEDWNYVDVETMEAVDLYSPFQLE